VIAPCGEGFFLRLESWTLATAVDCEGELPRLFSSLDVGDGDRSASGCRCPFCGSFVGVHDGLNG